MAKVYDGISPKLAAWIEAQPMFFVATAPLSADGFVNVSPKGTTGTFRVLGERTFAYVDITGSGVETLAHLRENGRICVMFCAFDGPPNIVRLHGSGRVVINGEPGFDAALERFGEAGTSRRVQTRSVITVDVTRVSDSCGFAVPAMDLRAERDLLDSWAVGKTPEMLDAYHAKKNATSLDGLPGVPADVRTAAPKGT
ncbi:pyridoxamine 5'-phosphate oxidase family protein [Pseudonocardia bannensis]|uniref:Pyridoxamine 5'-phosphate oxidase family protein n=1 Tax=Pseudonocardia bannensis TaxID=630973 RepID=A0A848DKE5_9PSEU|nr:pyridoxamine 5'-phosphate oxidase family protein [Pseudonocardia bannensis]NMH92941.1 pyridoxamine 5'-phosphate oxidase family protein [Pseudonocardia bannensis]